MRIEKYHAVDMQEAFRLIKKDLGSDAVVIQTRKVRVGLLGWLKKPVYEVIAAVDEEAKATKFAASVPTLPKAVVAGAPSAPAAATGRAATASSTVLDRAAGQTGVALPATTPSRAAGAYASTLQAPAKAPPKGASVATPVLPAALPATAEGNGTDVKPDVHNADVEPPRLEGSDVALLREMRGNMLELKTAMSRLSKQAQFGNIANFSPVLVNLYQRLIDQELAEDMAQDIVLHVNTELGSHGVNNYDLVRERVRKHIQESISVSGPPRLLTGKAKCLFLIGPTGVGKTTTLAKLAANYCLVEHKKVALVTVDTFRIAAIPQLRTYADIIGVPLEVVYTPADLHEALKRFADCDLVLIDTPGGSPRNTAQLDLLKDYLQAIENKEVYLVVASSTKYRDMVDAFKRFSIAPIDGLLFTKIDETDIYGPLINLLNETRTRLTYLTTGQNVPQDIELADSLKMAELLLSERSQ